MDLLLFRVGMRLIVFGVRMGLLLFRVGMRLIVLQSINGFVTVQSRSGFDSV